MEEEEEEGGSACGGSGAIQEATRRLLLCPEPALSVLHLSIQVTVYPFSFLNIFFQFGKGIFTDSSRLVSRPAEDAPVCSRLFSPMSFLFCWFTICAFLRVNSGRALVQSSL